MVTMPKPRPPRPNNKICILCFETIPVEERGTGCVGNKAHVMYNGTKEEFIKEWGDEPSF